MLCMRFYKVFCSISCVLSLLLTDSCVLHAAQNKKKKLVKFDEEMKKLSDARLNLGFEIPPDPEKRTWRVSGKINGQVIYPSLVPLYSFDGESFGGILDEIKVGTVIKLEKVRVFQGRHFYGIPKPIVLPNGKSFMRWFWIDGISVEPAS